MFPYTENNHLRWLIFFRGVETTNQLKPPTSCSSSFSHVSDGVCFCYPAWRRYSFQVWLAQRYFREIMMLNHYFRFEKRTFYFDLFHSMSTYSLKTYFSTIYPCLIRSTFGKKSNVDPMFYPCLLVYPCFLLHLFACFLFTCLDRCETALESIPSYSIAVINPAGGRGVSQMESQISTKWTPGLHTFPFSTLRSKEGKNLRNKNLCVSRCFSSHYVAENPEVSRFKTLYNIVQLNMWAKIIFHSSIKFTTVTRWCPI